MLGCLHDAWKQPPIKSAALKNALSFIKVLQELDMTTSPPPEAHIYPNGLEKILTALKDLKFGSVEVTVHEGRIVQIERREKHRLNLPI